MGLCMVMVNQRSRGTERSGSCHRRMLQGPVLQKLSVVEAGQVPGRIDLTYNIPIASRCSSGRFDGSSGVQKRASRPRSIAVRHARSMVILSCTMKAFWKLAGRHHSGPARWWRLWCCLKGLHLPPNAAMVGIACVLMKPYYDKEKQSWKLSKSFLDSIGKRNAKV